MGLFARPKVVVTPTPSAGDAAAKAAEARRLKQKSAQAFIGRQSTLGPIQLQAPMIKL